MGGCGLAMAGVVLCLAMAMTLPDRALAWGVDGHRVTCLLAESLLEPATVNAVRDLLPENANGSLASLCSWPDEIVHTDGYHWTLPLHFINTPDFLCRYNYDRDCHDSYGHEGFCASGAIKNYTAQLTKYHSGALAVPPRRTKSLDTTCKWRGSLCFKSVVDVGVCGLSDNLTEALLFLAHIVGDIHQPLHVAFTSDLGGNTIMVDWYGSRENLHFIWDVEIIERARNLYYNNTLETMVEAITQNITNNWIGQTQLWSECSSEEISCPDKYASEGINLACQWAYRNATPGSTLGDEYFLSRLPIVEKRLAQGGVRLAAILNRLYSANST